VGPARAPVIHLDTSLLIDALSGRRRAAPLLRRAAEHGERVGISTLVLYEWLRGPRRRIELAHQEELFPADAVVPFGVAESLIAARLYRQIPRARHRELDLAIAACALAHRARIWTLNPDDFRDVPDLTLYEPPSS
jgi:predicted nucleic acid-binding protein